MSQITEMLEKLEVSLNAAKEFAKEFEGGKKIASNKLRKEAQTSKTIWQELRFKVMEELKAMPTKTREPKA